MPTPQVIDQEFVVHLFAPLDGPLAERAFAQVKRIWTACRQELGMQVPITGLPWSAPPSIESVNAAAAESVLAGAQSQAGVRQVVLRRVHDVLNLSVALAQPSPEGRRSRRGPRLSAVGSGGSRPERPLGWADHAGLWDRASRSQADELLGEARVFLARMPPVRTGYVSAAPDLGQALDPLLPYREDRRGGWWRWGTATTAGYAVWDTGLAADIGPSREIVLVAGADRDEDLSAWVWSDRTPAMPPFARYLMHVAKLRYEARLLESWHGQASPRQDIDTLMAELDATLEPASPEGARLLGSLTGRLRAAEHGLTRLDADLARLGQTVSIAQCNLAAQPGCGANGSPAGIFGADQSLAGYLSGQVSSDRGYLQIELGRIRSVRTLAAEALSQTEEHRTPSAPARSVTAKPDAGRRVFVVHGRDGALARSFFDLMYLVGLEPLEWERLVEPTGTTAPYLGDVVRQAPHLAQATLVLLSPDDIVELHPDLRLDSDQPHERTRAGQARPNVLFELGLAFMAYPERTIIVEAGLMRPIADLAGLNVIRFDGSAMAIKKVVDRLSLAGCPVDISGADWLDPARFAGLGTYRRAPGAEQHDR
jgi:predicted nucleotide-binding protein